MKNLLRFKLYKYILMYNNFKDCFTAIFNNKQAFWVFADQILEP